VTNDFDSRPLRADARRNRARLLSVALAAFTKQGAEAPLESIAREAGVGIGTLYRHFPNREALILEVYQNEVDQLCRSAPELLKTLPPDEALRAWLDRMARYSLTKHGLAGALRSVSSADGVPVAASERIYSALETLLSAGIKAGTIRSDLSVDDVLLALSGLWRLDPQGDWQGQAHRLIDLLMDGLKAGAANRT
jgi:AcrR family transcriptional regulator